ncbi:MAG: hypothetical protein WC600_15645 [Desulfobaccales bacterium]
MLVNWTNLNGTLTSDPAVIRIDDVVTPTRSRLEVFVRGADNGLYNIRRPGVSTPWEAWKQLGLSAVGGPMLAGKPTVALNLDERLEVFWRGVDNVLYHIVETAPNSNAYSTPAPLGVFIQSDPVAIQDSAGRIVVFYLRAGNRCEYVRQEAANTGPYSRRTLGGIHTSNLAVELNGGAINHLEVFAVGTDNAMWHIWQTASFSNGTTSGDSWSDWESLGGNHTSDPSVVRNLDGRLEVFALGTNYNVYHMWQPAPASGPWSAWENLPAGPFTSSPVAIRDQFGTLQVFVVDISGNVVSRIQRDQASNWGPRDPDTGPGAVTLGEPWTGKVNPILASRALGPLEVFIRGPVNNLAVGVVPVP